jgi:hypothetical protein
LSGAEKQRRHREKVKARLAEGERLKALLGEGGLLPGFAVFCDALFDELGAAADEREALKSRAAALQAELRGGFEARLRDEIEILRERRRKQASSLLARLGAVKPGKI